MELKGLKVDWIESIHETLKLATEASEAFKRFADNVMACSMLRQRICSHFDKDKGECTLDWDPSIVELVKDLKLESAQPFTVVEKSESLWGSRMKIKPSPLWCSMACPNFKME
jgi:hypothetical protein